MIISNQRIVRNDKCTQQSRDLFYRIVRSEFEARGIHRRSINNEITGGLWNLLVRIHKFVTQWCFKKSQMTLHEFAADVFLALMNMKSDEYGIGRMLPQVRFYDHQEDYFCDTVSDEIALGAMLLSVILFNTISPEDDAPETTIYKMLGSICYENIHLTRYSIHQDGLITTNKYDGPQTCDVVMFDGQKHPEVLNELFGHCVPNHQMVALL